VVSVNVEWTGPPVGLAPTYDANGNLLSDGTYGNRTYTYDALGRLTGVAGNGQTLTYNIDGLGNRWAESVNGITTSFDLDLSAANPTLLADGTRTYLPGAPAAGHVLAGTWHSGLLDLVGSPIQYVSETGAETGDVGQRMGVIRRSHTGSQLVEQELAVRKIIAGHADRERHRDPLLDLPPVRLPWTPHRSIGS